MERGMFRDATDLIKHCNSEFAAYDLEERRDQAREASEKFALTHEHVDFTFLVGAWTKLVLAMAYAQKFDQRRALRNRPLVDQLQPELLVPKA